MIKAEAILFKHTKSCHATLQKEPFLKQAVLNAMKAYAKECVEKAVSISVGKSTLPFTEIEKIINQIDNE